MWTVEIRCDEGLAQWAPLKKMKDENRRAPDVPRRRIRRKTQGHSQAFRALGNSPDKKKSNSEPQKADGDGWFRPGRTTQCLRLDNPIDRRNQQAREEKHGNKIQTCGVVKLRLDLDQGSLLCRAKAQTNGGVWRQRVLICVLIVFCRHRY